MNEKTTRKNITFVKFKPLQYFGFLEVQKEISVKSLNWSANLFFKIQWSTKVTQKMNLSETNGDGLLTANIDKWRTASCCFCCSISLKNFATADWDAVKRWIAWFKINEWEQRS